LLENPRKIILEIRDYTRVTNKQNKAKKKSIKSKNIADY